VRETWSHSLLGFAAVHQRHFHADVHSRHGRRFAPALRRRHIVPARAARARIEQDDVGLGVVSGLVPNSIHHQFFLEHVERAEERG
jgi:hypothetical protein